MIRFRMGPVFLALFLVHLLFAKEEAHHTLTYVYLILTVALINWDWFEVRNWVDQPGLGIIGMVLAPNGLEPANVRNPRCHNHKRGVGGDNNGILRLPLEYECRGCASIADLVESSYYDRLVL